MWDSYISSYINGALIGAGLIVAIGAQNAFVLAQSVRREYHWQVALTCMLCDAVLITVGVFGLATVLAENHTLLAAVRWGGIAFLLWYSVKALSRALSPQGLQANQNRERSFARVMATTLAVTLLNPHVYLDTVLLVGSLGAQQSSSAAYAAGAVNASLLWFTLLAGGGALLSRHLARPVTWRILDVLVASMMLVLAFRLIQTS